MPDQPTTPAENATLREHFEHFLKLRYDQPPSPIDPDEDVRTLYWHLRETFYAGCLVGQTHPMAYLTEMTRFAEGDDA